MPAPLPGLDVHVDVHAREQADERRQEGPPLAGLVVHAREADRELALVDMPCLVASYRSHAAPAAAPARAEVSFQVTAPGTLDRRGIGAGGCE